MVVQDALTGTLHEVDEGQFQESEIAEPEPVGETVFDGLGNPVGFFNPFKLIGGLFGGSRRRRRARRQAAPIPDQAPPPEPPPDESGAGEAYDGFGYPVGMFPFPLPRPPIPRLPIPGLPMPFRGLNLGLGRRRVWSPSLRRFISMVWNPTQRRWVNTGPVPPPVPVPARFGPGLFPRWRTPPGWMRPLGPVTGANRMYLRCSTWPGPAGLMPMGAGQPGVPGMPGMGPRRRRYRRSRR
jgi:hypothetical protein